MKNFLRKDNPFLETVFQRAKTVKKEIKNVFDLCLIGKQ